MHGQNIARPWFLAGGLNAKNVREAVELSGAKALDVSSGVEPPGVKDPALIKALLGPARWGAETPCERALARARSGAPYPFFATELFGHPPIVAHRKHAPAELALRIE
jgi:hypothetical protein